MRRLRGWLIALFTVGGLSALALFNAHRPRVLVLHSGSEDSLWVNDVDLGMQRELERDRRPLQLDRIYLRLDRPLANPESARIAWEDAERAIARLRPEIVVAVDDEANALLAKYLPSAERPRLLYVSIDQPPAVYGYQDDRRVSGISEELPLAAVRDALRELQDQLWSPPQAEAGASAEVAEPQPPKRKPLRIAAIARNSDTGRAELEQVRSFDWAPHLTGPLLAVDHWEQWQQQVSWLAREADVVLVLSYQGLPRGERDPAVVRGDELARWMEAESLPLPIGLHVSYVVDGGGFSLAPAPLSYGEGAMRMALEWLDPRRNGALPAAWQSTHFDVALRAGCWQRRGLSLPAIYAEAARAGNDFYAE